MDTTITSPDQQSAEERPKTLSPEELQKALDAEITALPAPSEREQARIAEAVQRGSKRPPRVVVGPAIDPVHSDVAGWLARLRDAFGTGSDKFVRSSLVQLRGVAGDDELNTSLALVEGIQPENEAEGALAVQMAGVHATAMEMLRRSRWANTPQAINDYGNLATKLLRTYTAQLEALGKIRRRGEQTVVVKHVHVYPGAQAIVGPVTGGMVGEDSKNRGQPHAPNGADGTPALEYSPGAEMWSEDASEHAVPIAGGVGTKAVPHARRSKRKRSP